MEKHIKNQWLSWLGLLILIFIEYSLFRTYSLREIIPFYPKSYDQTVYLAESYKLYEQMLERGRIFAALMQHHFLPQTLLFHVQAALVFLVFGASRMSVLSINFLYFIALQLFAMYAFKHVTGRYRYGFMFVGVLLAANSLVMANDFRIDFIVACLYGMLCFAILRSDVFVSRKWSLISAAIAAFLIMMRYITICYVLGMLSVVSAYYVGMFLIKKKSRPITVIRLHNLFIYSLCLLSIIFPVVWFNWDMIHAYYIVGHVTGAEKMMRLQIALRAINFNSAYLFYPVMFFKMHLSFNTVLQIALTIFVYAIQLFLFRNVARMKLLFISSGEPRLIDYNNIITFLVISILIPLFVLSMDESKSVLVINVTLVPFIALMLFSYVYCSEKLWLKAPVLANKSLSMISVIFLIIGFYNYTSHFSKERGHRLSSDKDYVITQMVDDIGNYANFLNWKTINLSSDFLADYLNAPLSAFYYERHGVYFDVNTLPLGNNGMTAITKLEAFNSLNHTDIYTVNLTDYKPDPIFPFENSIKSFRTELQKIAAQSMIVLGDYFVADNIFRVYARPDVRIRGVVNNKIDGNGIWLDVPAPVAQQVNKIVLVGDAEGKHYRIAYTLPKAHYNKPLTIHLTVMSVPTKIYFFKI